MGFTGRMSPQNSKARWDVLNEEFGHPGNPNDNTPEGVARPEPDSTPGEDADSNTRRPRTLKMRGRNL